LRVISKRKLREFWEKHPDSKEPLLDWYNVTRKASWRNLADVRESFRHADTVGDCTVFNIKGNNYRLVTAIRYNVQRIYTLHVLTHKEYDKEKWKKEKMTVIARTGPNPSRARRQFDQRKYGRLLARAVPAVIRNEAECRRVENEIAKLLRKGEALTVEEDRLLELLSVLVEKYEDETEIFPDSPPHRILQYLMEQNDMQQVDLMKIFGSSGRVSEAVNGKRGISKAQSKALGKLFKVSPELFI
jgi:mRNA-degrading endonuclease HigB of HigAB toxin-antitoxin module/antitoxin component HigA of HigAB toxin-antitoxin module